MIVHLLVVTVSTVIKTSQRNPSKNPTGTFCIEYLLKRYLTGSVGKACNSWSQGPWIQAHVGYRGYLKILKKKKKNTYSGSGLFKVKLMFQIFIKMAVML